MAAANSDMRLVIAGAGGRMGRTLIHAIAATKGVTLAGAIEAADSAVIGRDAGELAGLGANGIKVVSDPAPLLKGADGLIEFTIPAGRATWKVVLTSGGPDDSPRITPKRTITIDARSLLLLRRH